jgi:hypothetical protein
LLEPWFKEHAEQHCSLKTVERYRQLVAYLQADFCAHDIAEVDPLVLEQEFNRLRANWRTSSVNARSEATQREDPSALLPQSFTPPSGRRSDGGSSGSTPWKPCNFPRVDQKEKEVLDTARQNVPGGDGLALDPPYRDVRGGYTVPSRRNARAAGRARVPV